MFNMPDDLFVGGLSPRTPQASSDAVTLDRNVTVSLDIRGGTYIS